MQIKSEIAGIIIQLNFKDGDLVIPEDEIAVLESMKLQIPIPANGKGLIAYKIKQDDFVDTNTIIAEID